MALWLPLPRWDKNDRVGTVLRRTQRMVPGQKYLTPLGRDYRDGVVTLVRPALPRRPWFDKRRPWHISFVQYVGDQSADDDHYLSGVRDDICHAGLVENDSESRISRVVLERTEPKGIFVIASQEGWA